MIEAPITITTATPPVDVVAEIPARIAEVKVAENQDVQKGELLLILENPAQRNDMELLERQLEEDLIPISVSSLRSFRPDRSLQLGPLEEVYAEFLRHYDDYLLGSASDFDRQRIRQKQAQIKRYEKSIELEETKEPDIQERINLANREIKRIQKNYSTNPEKYSGQLEKAIATRTSAQTELKNVETGIVAIKIQIEEQRDEIETIQQQSGQSNAKLLSLLEEDVSKLLSRIEQWREQYLIYAPASGQVTFYETFSSEQQFVRAGEVMLTIVPPGQGDIFGRVKLPLVGAGKVDTGQVVIIKLKSFPYREYGVLRGEVQQKDIIPKDDVYNLQVSVPKTLITSYDQSIPFTQEMQGTAEIITRERRLLQRLFEGIFAFAEDY